jgi:two-component system chemotaxis sensor kinase CheA
VDEHLQTLDEILIQLERLQDDSEALQAAFRSAHTLKGMAGVVGHTRMVNLTHALETVLDGLRKGTLCISTPLIDLSLEAVDGLRLLREEVSGGEQSDLDADSLVGRFALLSPAGATRAVVAVSADSLAAQSPTSALLANPPAPVGVNLEGEAFEISAQIDPRSVASAARAFQLMLALQELGTIEAMRPTQAEIETTMPVRSFQARLRTTRGRDAVDGLLGMISEVENLSVHVLSGAGDVPAPAIEQPAGLEALREPTAGLPTPAPKNGKTPQRSDRLVRTSVERLDALMELIGELITDRNHLSQIRNGMNRERGAAMESQFDQLTETVAHLSRITDQLQEEVMRIRMLPISNAFHKFPRLVRDLAQKTGKKIDLVIRGEDTELDRSVIEEINDPLIHLLRNAVDHGIETPDERQAAGKPEQGTILLTARHEQGRIVITIEDDGCGINLDRLRASAVARGVISEEDARALSDDKALELVFLSGVSTARAVTDLSGRGVGMDIVRNNIQRISGNILVDTHPGEGTQFQIILPLTLAIIPTLLVRVAEIVCAVPIVMVAETFRLTPAGISTIRGRPVTIVRDKVLPLVYVGDAFRLYENAPTGAPGPTGTSGPTGTPGPTGAQFVVVVYHGKQQVGLVVDALVGEEEVVVKSLGALVGDVLGVSGATILGDGSVALIIDVPGVLKASETYG